MNDLAKRFDQNPLLKPTDITPSLPDLKVECLLNPGCFRYDGKTWLLLRVAERPEQKDGKVSFPVLSATGEIKVLAFDNDDKDLNTSDPRVINYKGKDYLTTLSHFRLVCSDDGRDFYMPDNYPAIYGKGNLENFGIEDCRVTKIDDTFYLTYTAVSESGVGVGMMSTKNWKDFNRYGLIIPPHNKDCALFTEKVNGKYYALHRPSSVQIGGNFIWIAESPDLLHWGNHQCIARTRPGMWDSARVGAGASPIKTGKGWLEIYHGANEENRYCLGALLLDMNDPAKVLARSHQPIMEPRAQYELQGFFGNVVFTNGHFVDGNKVTVYYGASDEVICGAEFSIPEILESLKI